MSGVKVLVQEFDLAIRERLALAAKALVFRQIQQFLGIAFRGEFSLDDLKGAGLADTGPITGGHNLGALGHELLHHGSLAFFVDLIFFPFECDGFHRFGLMAEPIL
jgi:hypothetical protein